jgi:hypothetical protein
LAGASADQCLVMGAMKCHLMILTLLISALCSSAEDAPKFHASVSLAVSAPDSIKREVTSFLSRELRELGDVTLVESGGNAELQVVVMELTSDGENLGFAFSVVSFLHLPPWLVEKLSVSGPSGELDKGFVADLVTVPDHWLKVGGSGDLKVLCQKVVATFDTEVLAEMRQGAAVARKEFEERKPRENK